MRCRVVPLALLVSTRIAAQEPPRSLPASRPASAPASVPGSGPGTRPLPAKPSFRETVLQTAADQADGRLGRDTALEVDGTTFVLRELEQQAAAEGAMPDRAAAALAVADAVLVTVLANVLRRAGSWPDAATLDQRFEELRARLDATPFTTEVMATKFKGYPTLQAYRRRFDLLTAYGLWIEKELTDEALTQALRRARPFLAGREVQVALLCFAPQRAGDWPDAGRRAEEAVRALRSGESFDAWYQKAGPRSGPATYTLNTLRTAVSDSEYSRFLVGRSWGDELFSSAPVGEVVGPLRGVDAFWVGRVEERTAPDKAFSVQDPRIRELVRTIHLEERLLAWSEQVLARAILRVHAR